MSGLVVGWAFKRPDLTPTQRLVLLGYADNAQDDGKCWPNKQTIIAKTGLSQASVYRAVKDLTDLGLLREEADEKGRACVWLAVSHGEKNPLTVRKGFSQGEKDSHSEKTFSHSEKPYIDEPSKEPSEETNGVSPVFPDDVRRLCELQARLAAERTERKPKPVSQTWLAEMDRLIRLDGRSVKQIEYVIKWVHADSFWGSNILSVPKLREKFDQLVANIKRDSNGSAKKGDKDAARRERTRKRMAVVQQAQAKEAAK